MFEREAFSLNPTLISPSLSLSPYSLFFISLTKVEISDCLSPNATISNIELPQQQVIRRRDF